VTREGEGERPRAQARATQTISLTLATTEIPAKPLPVFAWSMATRRATDCAFFLNSSCAKVGHTDAYFYVWSTRVMG